MFNHQVSKEQNELAKNLWRDLGSWKKFTIGIDGPDGVGKSVLARFLSWELNMPVIETDLYIDDSRELPNFRYDELKTIINNRHSLNRPLIVEGVFLLDTMKNIKANCDVLVYVENSECEGSKQLFEKLESYRKQYKPKENAKYKFSCEFVDT